MLPRREAVCDRIKKPRDDTLGKKKQTKDEWRKRVERKSKTKRRKTNGEWREGEAQQEIRGRMAGRAEGALEGKWQERSRETL